MAAPTQEELQDAHCWEADDRIPRRPAMTEFRQATRLHHARWRVAHGLPIGTQPIVPEPGDPRTRLVGSRLRFDEARSAGATFVTPAALDAARRRVALVEPHQTFDHRRLWADLLWSPTLSFNLFGELAADTTLADRAVHTWWPDAPGSVREVRFAHSPGRWDWAYLHSLRAFAAAFVLERDDATNGVLGVSVRYHERSHPETPRPENHDRYREVAERSGAFRPGAIDVLLGRGDLCELWLEHLLLLSMLQHADGRWTWGRVVLVHPAGNVDVADQVARYRAMLADASTFAAITLEELLDSGALPPATTAAVGERYVVAR
jgi:hypothetical protein